MRMRRRRAGEPQHLDSYNELLPQPAATVPDLTTLDTDPHRHRLRAEARELVERGLLVLPEAFRVPLLLADIAELQLSDIAGIIGLQEATVKTRIHRARLKLRAILGRGLPQRTAGPATHERAICLDLLRARLAAFDQGVEFKFPKASMCERCQSIFATLDLSASICGALAHDSLPPALRTRLLAAAGR